MLITTLWATFTDAWLSLGFRLKPPERKINPSQRVQLMHGAISKEGHVSTSNVAGEGKEEGETRVWV